jgi:cell pole-organizing protein PopZ
MPVSSPQHEPTMEEILASIRKIISEDTHEAPAPKAEPEVLELTQEVPEEPAQPPPPPAMETSHVEAAEMPEPAGESAQDTLEFTPAEHEPVENNVVSISHEELTVSSPATQDNGIFSDKARKAIDDAFAGLDQIAEKPRTQSSRGPAMPPVEGNSVEAVFERAVRASVDPVLAQWMSNHQGDLMNAVKPLLREWMDDHFPALLEGAVREEVARVIRARGGR